MLCSAFTHRGKGKDSLFLICFMHLFIFHSGQLRILGSFKPHLRGAHYSVDLLPDQYALKFRLRVKPQ